MAASHAKILTIDSDKSLVSSANLSYHGLSGNIEMGFLVRSADKAKQIEELLKKLVRMHVYKKYPKKSKGRAYEDTLEGLVDEIKAVVEIQ